MIMIGYAFAGGHESRGQDESRVDALKPVRRSIRRIGSDLKQGREYKDTSRTAEASSSESRARSSPTPCARLREDASSIYYAGGTTLRLERDSAQVN